MLLQNKKGKESCVTHQAIKRFSPHCVFYAPSKWKKQRKLCYTLGNQKLISPVCVLCSFKTKKSSLFIFRFINFAKTKSEFRASKDALLFSLIIFKVSRIILSTNIHKRSSTHLPPPVEAGKSPLVWGFGNKNEVRHSAPYPVQTAIYRYDKWQLFKCFSSFPQTSSLARPAPPCTTPTGSGRGGHPDHTWHAVQHWESIQDEKSGIKVLYFNHLLHFLHSAVCPLSTDPKDSRINHTRLSLYNAERIQPRTGHGTGPPPIEAGKRPLVQGFVNKNSVKTPYPMEVVRLLEYHQSKMPLLSGT